MKPKYITMHRVDTRNMVPEWMTSVNQAYAKAIKPKFTYKLSKLVTQLPPVNGHQVGYEEEVDEPVKTFTLGTSNKSK